MNTAITVGLVTTAIALSTHALAMPAIAQQRICVESERDGRVVCGRRVYVDDNTPSRPGSISPSSKQCGSNFDENFYLTAYPDVADAVRRGKVQSACAHYQTFGRFEGRQPTFNESSYLLKNPDVADAVRRGQVRSGYDHWRRFGRYENRQL